MDRMREAHRRSQTDARQRVDSARERLAVSIHALWRGTVCAVMTIHSLAIQLQPVNNETRAYERLCDALSFALTYRNTARQTQRSLAASIAIVRAVELIVSDFTRADARLMLRRALISKGLPSTLTTADEIIAAIEAKP